MSEGRKPPAVSALRGGARRDAERLRPPEAAAAAAAGRGYGGSRLPEAERRESAALPPAQSASAPPVRRPGNEGQREAGGAFGGTADPRSSLGRPDQGLGWGLEAWGGVLEVTEGLGVWLG